MEKLKGRKQCHLLKGSCELLKFENERFCQTQDLAAHDILGLVDSDLGLFSLISFFLSLLLSFFIPFVLPSLSPFLFSGNCFLLSSILISSFSYRASYLLPYLFIYFLSSHISLHRFYIFSFYQFTRRTGILSKC
jgi:hypothetical protein